MYPVIQKLSDLFAFLTQPFNVTTAPRCFFVFFFRNSLDFYPGIMKSNLGEDRGWSATVRVFRSDEPCQIGSNLKYFFSSSFQFTKHCRHYHNSIFTTKHQKGFAMLLCVRTGQSNYENSSNLKQRSFLILLFQELCLLNNSR